MIIVYKIMIKSQNVNNRQDLWPKMLKILLNLVQMLAKIMMEL